MFTLAAIKICTQISVVGEKVLDQAISMRQFQAGKKLINNPNMSMLDIQNQAKNQFQEESEDAP